MRTGPSILRRRLIVYLACGLLLITVKPADADYFAKISLSASSGPAGSNITITGTSFKPGSSVDIRWDNELNGALLVPRFSLGPNENGFTKEVTIPSASPGPHKIYACGFGSNFKSCNHSGQDTQHAAAEAPFTVTSPPSPGPTASASPSASPSRSPSPSPRASRSPSPSPAPGPAPTAPPTLVGGIGAGMFGPATTIEPRATGGFLLPGTGYTPRCAPQSGSTIIDFDDVASGSEIPLNHYVDQGVTQVSTSRDFTPVPVTTYSPSVGTLTAPNALGAPADTTSTVRTVTFRFTTPVYYAGIHVGSEATATSEDFIINTDFPELYDSVSLNTPTPAVNCAVVAMSTPSIRSISVYTRNRIPILMDRLFFSSSAPWAPPPFLRGYMTISSFYPSVYTPGVLEGQVGFGRDIPDASLPGHRFDRVTVLLPGWGGGIEAREAELQWIDRRARGMFRLPGVTLRPGTHVLTATGTGPGAFATGAVTVTVRDGSTRPSPRTIDLVPVALEVNQGTRGAIAPVVAGGAVNETAIHVANRKTVVRGYSRIATTSTATSVLAGAQLHGTRDGASLPGSPLEPWIPARPAKWTETGFALLSKLQQVRRELVQSWNFELPPSWTAGGAIQLRLEVNTPGPLQFTEVTGTSAANSVTLRNVRFTQVDPREVYVFAADYYERNREGRIIHNAPTYTEVERALDGWWRSWPLPDEGLRTFIREVSISDSRATPPITDPPNWDNAYLTREARSYIDMGHAAFVPLMFSPRSGVGCSGRAGIGSPPLFHGGACWATMAQEAGHSLGLRHFGNAHGELEGGGYIDRFSGDHGQLESNTFGWDVVSMLPISPTAGEDVHAHDFMSYGRDPRWTSVYGWNQIARLLIESNPSGSRGGVRAAGPIVLASAHVPSGPAAMISGAIREGNVTFKPAFSIDSAIPEKGEGPYVIEVKDATGASLYRRSFSSTELQHTGTGGDEFSEIVPMSSNASTIEVSKEGKALGTVTRSPGPPIVAIDSPTAGAELKANQKAKIAWSASDPDGDPLTYLVEASSDGKRWELMRAGTKARSMTFSPEQITTQGQVTIRVIASDGFNSTAATVGPITVPPRAAKALIIQPHDGDHVPTNRPLDLLGTVSGRDLPADSELEWLLDGKLVGAGNRWTVQLAKPGRHKVTLRWVAASGLKTQRTITVLAGADSDGDRMPDAWERDHDLNPGSANDATRDPDRDGLVNQSELSNGSDPNEVDTDGDRYADNIEVDGGSDPANRDSIPVKLHGMDTVPMLPAGTLLWWLVGAGVVLVAGTTSFMLRRRSRRSGASA